MCGYSTMYMDLYTVTCVQQPKLSIKDNYDFLKLRALIKFFIFERRGDLLFNGIDAI